MEPTGSEEVKIPELTANGRNWKIYRAKYLEVAATEGLLSIVAGWELDDGTKDWAHRAETQYPTHGQRATNIPISFILFL